MKGRQERQNPEYSAPSRNIPSLASTLSDILVLWSSCIHPHSTAFIQHGRNKSAPLLCEPRAATSLPHATTAQNAMISPNLSLFLQHAAEVRLYL